MSDEYESTLAAAAAKLQNVVTIGQVKHIGLRQVPGAIDMLIAEKDAEIERLRKLLRCCVGVITKSSNDGPTKQEIDDIIAASALAATKGKP